MQGELVNQQQLQNIYKEVRDLQENPSLLTSQLCCPTDC